MDDEAKLKLLQDTAPFYGYNHEHEKQSWLETYKPLITKKYRDLFRRDPVTELIQSCYRSFSNKNFKFQPQRRDRAQAEAKARQQEDAIRSRNFPGPYE